jgi:hypothetical protein
VDERKNQYPPAVTVLGAHATGDVFPMFSVGGPQDLRVWYSIDYWVGISEFVAVAYVATEGVHVPVSFVVYSPPSTEILRSLGVRGLTALEDHWPRWEDSAPPTPDDLRQRWLLEVVRGDREVQYATPVDLIDPDGRMPSDGVVLARIQGETPDEFYARVGRVYDHLQAVSKRPTTGIAQAGQVPYTTAAKWVREARKRGHLAPSNKGGE